MEVTCYSEMSVDFLRTIRCYVAEKETLYDTDYSRILCMYTFIVANVYMRVCVCICIYPSNYLRDRI
jgi:hypothetical protein